MLRLTLDGPSAAAEYRQAASIASGGSGCLDRSCRGPDAGRRFAQGAANQRIGPFAWIPRRFEALQVLGEACIQERDYEAAIPPLQQALQVQPLNSECVCCSGLLSPEIGTPSRKRYLYWSLC